MWLWENEVIKIWISVHGEWKLMVNESSRIWIDFVSWILVQECHRCHVPSNIGVHYSSIFSLPLREDTLGFRCWTHKTVAECFCHPQCHQWNGWIFCEYSAVMLFDIDTLWFPMGTTIEFLDDFLQPHSLFPYWKVAISGFCCKIGHRPEKSPIFAWQKHWN